MQTQTLATCSIREASHHKYEISYHGLIDDLGVETLVRELDHGFNYYQFQKINLRLNSPGGSATAMGKVLRTFRQYNALGKWIEVHSSSCQSAAALILAFSRFGHRTMEPDGLLLFHSVRFAGGVAVTAQMATGLANVMSGIDSNLVAQLSAHLRACAGGTDQAMVDLLRRRLDILEANWDIVHTNATMFGFKTSSKRPEWYTRCRKICNGREPFKAYIKSLTMRMNQDTAMDLTEGYAYALIDVIEGVLGPLGLSEQLLAHPVSGPRRVAVEEHAAERDKLRMY